MGIISLLTCGIFVVLLLFLSISFYIYNVENYNYPLEHLPNTFEF